MGASAELEAVIRDEIRSHGPMTFARYMELALYHPELGYYRSRDPFGVSGDFYTAEQLQPVFGELLATYVEKLSRFSHLNGPYSVLELGAGRGDMRNAFAPWNYQAFDWHSQQLPDAWDGVVFANEFFDALPVYLLTKQRSDWKELFVDSDQTGFRYTPRDVSHPSLMSYAQQYGNEIPEGGQLEVCLAVEDWLSQIAGFLSHGHLLIVDYGYDIRELSRFPDGTLLAYRRHQACTQALREPGQRDITAHVNFTWLEDCARHQGLQLVRSQSLTKWALSVWEQPEFERRWAEADQPWHLQWKQIVFGLGETFRVLEFSSGPGR